MLTNKTSLVISTSKVKNELKKIRDEIVKVDESKLSSFNSSLSLDLGILIDHFKINEDNEYELMFMIGVLIDISLIFGQSDSKIDGVSVVSNWNKLSSSQRENQKKSVLKLSKTSDFFYSIQLSKTIKGFQLTQTQKIILLISDFLINSDGVKTDFEIKKREEIEKLITNSFQKVRENNLDIKNKLFSENSIPTENGKIVLTKFGDLKKILSLNQKTLNEFDNEFIKKIILTFKFLSDLEKNIQISEEKFKKINSSELVEALFETLFSEIRIFNYLFLMISKQIENALNNDYISYFEVNTIFDSMGIYISNSEKTTHDLLKKIIDNQDTLSGQLNFISNQLSSIEMGVNSLNQNVINLSKSVISLEMTMKNGFDEMSNNLQSIGNSISNGFSAISQNLTEINSSIQYNNLISTINAYQNYKINSKVTKFLN